LPARRPSKLGRFLSGLSLREFICASLVLILTAWGWSRAFEVGGQDFHVFHTAWQHILQGNESRIYTHSPDIFLYAPGFAWLLAPLGALALNPGLITWLLLMTLALAALVFVLTQALEREKIQLPKTVTPFLLVLLSIIACTKALQINVRYGQLNLFLLLSATWALTTYIYKQKQNTSFALRLSWFILGALGVSKLILVPLFFIPAVDLLNPRRRKRALDAMIFGILGAGPSWEGRRSQMPGFRRLAVVIDHVQQLLFKL